MESKEEEGKATRVSTESLPLTQSKAWLRLPLPLCPPVCWVARAPPLLLDNSTLHI